MNLHNQNSLIHKNTDPYPFYFEFYSNLGRYYTYNNQFIFLNHDSFFKLAHMHKRRHYNRKINKQQPISRMLLSLMYALCLPPQPPSPHNVSVRHYPLSPIYFPFLFPLSVTPPHTCSYFRQYLSHLFLSVETFQIIAIEEQALTL